MAGQLIPQWMCRPRFWKMEEPPKNIEEFLKFQNWDYWPREILFEDNDKWIYTLNKIKRDSSFTSIYTHLWENVPRIYDAMTIMESRLQECSILLENHASKIFQWDTIILETGPQGKLEKYKAYLRKYHKKKMIMFSEEMETKKNIEGCNFSGFKANELTQLPRHVDAERVYLFILKAHNFDEKVLKIWRTHFLSEASIALLHDSFWWWFLHKFKPDKENQDFLFDRISESYVTLFMSIPLSRKDAFFQVYPDCLAQAIYATFEEAFPESSDLFNDDFKEDLGNNIFLWLSGLKPQKGFWTQWKLGELSTTTIHGNKKAPSRSIKERIARSQERISNYYSVHETEKFENYCPTEIAANGQGPRHQGTNVFGRTVSQFLCCLSPSWTQSSCAESHRQNTHTLFTQDITIDFNMTKMLKNPIAYAMSTSKEESRLSRLTTKFRYSSTGPEFNHVLFNFGGQSPLVLYYLKRHKLPGISKAPRQNKVKLIEVSQEPLPAPTYHDVIKEAKRQFAKNRKDFRIEKHKIDEEIKLLRQRQERIDKELDRLQAKTIKKPYEVTVDYEKFLQKLQSEAQVEREFLRSLSSSSSTEDCNFEEEKH